MEFVTYPSADQFLHDVQSELERHEAENSLPLGLALGMRRTSASRGEAPFLAAVKDQRSWSLAALMTPPHPLIIAAAPGCPASAFPTLAAHLRQTGHPVSGVVGAPDTAAAFAVEWTRVSDTAIHHTTRQRVYRLTAVSDDLALTEGHLRRATRADLDLVGDWFTAFQVEVLDEMNRERSLRAATHRVEQGEIYLWEDSEPRGMAGRSRPTRNTITVNAVYTPPQWRRQGIATTAVAELSRALLSEGYSMCVLYTDLANPTSNSIYQRIGYEPVSDSAHLHFG